MASKTNFTDCAQISAFSSDELKKIIRNHNLQIKCTQEGNTSGWTKPIMVKVLCDHYKIPYSKDMAKIRCHSKKCETLIENQKLIPKSTLDKDGNIIGKQIHYKQHKPKHISERTITHIWHMSDIHLHSDFNEWKWERFHQIFQKTLELLQPSEGHLLVISGDLFHKPDSPNPNVFAIFGKFIRTACAKFGKDNILVISGNHDIRESITDPTSSRIEVIQSFAEWIDYFRYCRHNEVLQYGNTLVAISSLLNDETLRKEDIILPNTDTKYIYVAITHCDLIHPGTLEHSISSRHRTIELFKGYDYLLLGDIHESQEVSNSNPIAWYAGSLFQTNLGESIDGHGILLWDLFSQQSPKMIPIEDSYAYIRIKVVTGAITFFPSSARYKKNLIIRVEYTNTTKDQIRIIRNDLEKIYNIIQWTLVCEDIITHIIPENPEDHLAFTGHLSPIHQECLKNCEIEISTQIQNWTINSIRLEAVFNHVSTQISFPKEINIAMLTGENASGKSSLFSTMNIMFGKRVVGHEAVMKGRKSAMITSSVNIGENAYTISMSLLPKKNKSTECNIVIRNEKTKAEIQNTEAKIFMKQHLSSSWIKFNNISNNEFLQLTDTKRFSFLSYILGFDRMRKLIEEACKQNREAKNKRDQILACYNNVKTELDKIPAVKPLTFDKEKEIQTIKQKIDAAYTKLVTIPIVNISAYEEECLKLHPNTLTQPKDDEQKLNSDVIELRSIQVSPTLLRDKTITREHLNNLPDCSHIIDHNDVITETIQELQKMIETSEKTFSENLLKINSLPTSSQPPKPGKFDPKLYQETQSSLLFFSDIPKIEHQIKQLKEQITNPHTVIKNIPTEQVTTEQIYNLKLKTNASAIKSFESQILDLPKPTTPEDHILNAPIINNSPSIIKTQIQTLTSKLIHVTKPENLIQLQECTLERVPELPPLMELTSKKIKERDELESKLNLNIFTDEELDRAISENNLQKLKQIVIKIRELGLPQISSIIAKYNRLKTEIKHIESHNEQREIIAKQIEQINKHNKLVTESLSYYEFSRQQTIIDQLKQDLINAEYNEQLRKYQSQLQDYTLNQTRIATLEDLKKQETSLQIQIKDLENIRQNQLRQQLESLENQLKALIIEKNNKTRLLNDLLSYASYEKAKLIETNEKLYIKECKEDLQILYLREKTKLKQKLQDIINQITTFEETTRERLKAAENKLETTKQLRASFTANQKKHQIHERETLETELRKMKQILHNLEMENIQYNQQMGYIQRVEEQKLIFSQLSTELATAEERLKHTTEYLTILKQYTANYITNKCKQICNYAGELMHKCNVKYMPILEIADPDPTKNDSKISLRFRKDDIDFTSANLSSYEKFITNISLVTAFNKFATTSRLDVLLIDEGFGVIDKNNIKNLDILFTELSDVFSQIIIISHIGVIDTFADKVYYLKTQNGIPFVTTQ